MARPLPNDMTTYTGSKYDTLHKLSSLTAIYTDEQRFFLSAWGASFCPNIRS